MPIPAASDTMSAKSDATSTYLRRMGPHHFAHLRAVADGLSIHASAQRYLGIEHGNAALAAHRAVVELLRSMARRAGDARWRLVGLVIRGADGDGRPALADWAAANGLEGWSEAELQELYRQAFPHERRTARNQRLRQRQIEALRALEQLACEAPRPTDAIAVWFDPQLAQRLHANGLLLLQDLQRAVERGGRWWRSIPAIGLTKARRIESHLRQLLPAPGSALAAPMAASLALAAGVERRPRFDLVPQPPPGPNRAAVTGAAISATSDAQAIEQWVAARAGSQTTARAYQREAHRLHLWAAIERHKSFSALTAEDCLAYMTFLEHVPERWISRRRAAPMQPGWAPFAGQLTLASRRQAVVIVASLFAWLVKGGYLVHNPWDLVNRRTGDDVATHALDSRAFEPAVWAAMLAWIESQPTSPSRERVLFLLRFTEATGLRASELVSARLSDLRPVGGRWAMQVQGKGARKRIAAVPTQALRALHAYLLVRGLPPLERAPEDAPLVASVTDAAAPIGYQALYETVRSWLRRALRWAPLTEPQRRGAQKSSVHWLRHTCGTRALERGAPLEVVQAQLGHADPRTTMRYAKAQLQRLQDGMEKAFGE
ncbi:tyrosine-type recombinase/integrase [Azohydromonas caseinilytica]|uniref:Tyrosine-type recombinase/integrase n=1 Tax=Azohydromonas caseinilytica TaxID=2728836 RepID=A0A848FDJ2_9BURK|nr:tyrosine-type recombinase/integrase [Azohydromonas caseinilytica]NML15991.1 tyrosine-type recombinase/integrase [Azohydromonas caseinilytica]